MADEAHITNTVNFTSSRFHNFCQLNPGLIHQPISHEDPVRLDPNADDNHITTDESSNGNEEIPMQNMKCCCGRSDCAYLEHNNAALGGVEKDLETAARLGQALLDRHEAYVRESQAEQARLSTHLHDLEDEKTSLQDANHRMVVENRELLQKLEQLNNAFGESGKHARQLEELLADCEQEIRRLNGLTRKAQEMEIQVLDLERERCDMTREVQDGKFETRSTIARWKESERRVRQLEQEVQKIEWAARVDREKHEEIVARAERDRNLERELGLSEGRLKASAAVQMMQHAGPQKQVVSNFVRDILQDNASLQAGVAELRELLQTSNDEIEQLREQVMLHQPLHDDTAPLPQRTLSLGDELSLSHSLPQNPVQQEVHVHHHYHTKLGAKKEKTPVRKTPRRLAPMPQGRSPTSSGTSTPFARSQSHLSNLTNPVGIQVSKSRADRWSIQSTATASTYLSSIASSPTSCYDRKNSIFDRVEKGEESSRPTSPESFNMLSPVAFQRKDRVDDTGLSVFEEEDFDLDEESLPSGSSIIETADHDNRLTVMSNRRSSSPQDLTPRQSMNPIPQTLTNIPVEEAQVPANTTPNSLSEELSMAQQDAEPHHNDVLSTTTLVDGAVLKPPPTVAASKDHDTQPILRRSNSHESLMSISGMDIHLAQTSSRSTLALLQGHSTNKHHFAPAPAILRQASIPASQPLATVTEYTVVSQLGMDPSVGASVLALNGIRPYSDRTPTRHDNNKGLIGSVGGWVSSKWGKTPVTTNSTADLQAAIITAKLRTPSRPSVNHLTTSPNLVTSSRASIAPSTSSSGKRSVSSTGPDRPKLILRHESALADSFNASSFFARPSGINQSGPIPGFAAAIAARRAPIAIEPPKVDIRGLKESLAEQL